MPGITKSSLPPQSALHPFLGPGDFLDCYTCASRLPAPDAARIALKFPPWATALFHLRNALVRPLGLRTTAHNGPGIGHFPLLSQSPTEVLLGLDDTHLDFKISILTDGTKAFASTWVRPHNRMGRAYLTAIMPFHILILRNAMSQLARAT